MTDSGKGLSITFSPGALTIVFIILKLCKVIEWSWVWVLSPAWISLVLGILVVIGFVLYDRWQWKRKWEK